MPMRTATHPIVDTAFGAEHLDGESVRLIEVDVSPIAYRTVGNRAAQAWFGLTHLLDHPNVAVYHGSYADWGRLPDTPFEAPAA